MRDSFIFPGALSQGPVTLDVTHGHMTLILDYRKNRLIHFAFLLEEIVHIQSHYKNISTIRLKESDSINLSKVRTFWVVVCTMLATNIAAT